MPMGTNIKMSLMPKGINKIIYNPVVSISTPENVLIPYPQYPGGTNFFQCGCIAYLGNDDPTKLMVQFQFSVQ